MGPFLLSISLFFSLSAAGQKQVLEDNWKSFQLINASLICTCSPHRCPMVTQSASLQNPLFQIALFISPPAVSFSTGPSCILLGCLVKRKEVKKQKTKRKWRNKKEKMIHIKHNGYHFTFHQVDSWWLLWENNCPIFLISSLFFFSRWLNQENESFFWLNAVKVKCAHAHLDCSRSVSDYGAKTAKKQELNKLWHK